MTAQQLHLFNGLYLVAFVVVAYLTRATAWRIAGAVCGSALGAFAALGMIAVGEQIGWWRMAVTWEPYFLAVLWVDFVLSGFVFLLTWRIARRFGWQGLVIVALAAMLLGPVRDYRYMLRFPEWGSYAPGIAPMLAVSATYLLLGVLGHGVMRLIAGPAGADPLARTAGRAAA